MGEQVKDRSIHLTMAWEEGVGRESDQPTQVCVRVHPYSQVLVYDLLASALYVCTLMYEDS